MNFLSEFAWLLRFLQSAIPIVITLFFVLFGQLQMPVQYLSDIITGFAVISIYYWVIFRPELMPIIFVFFLGIIQDSLSGAPLGFNSLVYLLIHALVYNQRRFIVGKSFWLFWGGFAIVLVLAVFCTWCLASIVRGSYLAPEAAVIGLIMTIIMFPAIVWLLGNTQRRFIGSARFF